MPPARPLADRFWEKVDRWDPDECWLWKGGHSAGTGYASISRNGRPIGAHRVAYELCIGPIPPGLSIDHLCRRRGCVNPRHLEPVTPQENCARGVPYRIQTECRRGHPFTPANTVTSSGRRTCRECRNASSRAYYDRHLRRPA